MEDDGEIERIRAWIMEQVRIAGAADLLILETVIKSITA